MDYFFFFFFYTYNWRSLVYKLCTKNVQMKLPIRFVDRLNNSFAPNAGYIRHVRCDVIKSFVLCDCKTGYISDFVIYTEAGTTIESEHKECSKSGNIVMSLL